MSPKHNGEFENASRAEVQALRDDLAALRTDIKSLWSDAEDMVGTAARKQFANGKATAEKAREQATKAKAVAEDKVKDHPYTAVLVALGVGAVIGLMQRRNS